MTRVRWAYAAKLTPERRVISRVIRHAKSELIRIFYRQQSAVVAPGPQQHKNVHLLGLVGVEKLDVVLGARRGVCLQARLQEKREGVCALYGRGAFLTCRKTGRWAVPYLGGEPSYLQGKEGGGLCLIWEGSLLTCSVTIWFRV